MITRQTPTQFPEYVVVLCVLKTKLLYCRCFSFGIGEGASSALINGLAKEGGGHAQFITGIDRMQPKVRLHSYCINFLGKIENSYALSETPIAFANFL